MVELISWGLAFFLVYGLPALICKGKSSGRGKSSNTQKFGDGKSRYDFKDYVNSKLDK